MLRVTSGSVRGFRLEVPRLGSVRPPLEMLREAVFNILGQDLEGWRVVDLFAGCGIMGIEALSRGAEHVLFVEKHRVAAATITRNLERVRLLDRARVVTGNAFSAPRHIIAAKPVDLVFLDPPFQDTREFQSQAKVLDLVGGLFESGALDPDATVVLRLPSNILLQDPPAGSEVVDQRIYGNSRIVFFAGKPSPPEESPSAPLDDEGSGPPAPPQDASSSEPENPEGGEGER